MTTDSGTTTNPSSEINTTTGGIVIYSAGGINMSAATNTGTGTGSTGNSAPSGDICIQGAGQIYVMTFSGSPGSHPGENDINLDAQGNVNVFGAGYIKMVTGSGTGSTDDNPIGPNDINLDAQGNVNVFAEHFNTNVSGNSFSWIAGFQENFILGTQVNGVGGGQANSVGGDQTNVVLGAQENITIIDLLCLVLGAQQNVNIGPVETTAPYVIDKNAVKIEQLEARMWDTNFSVKNILAELENTENKLDQTVSRLEQAETRLTQAETNIIT